MAKVDYFICDICGKAIEEDTGFDRHLVIEVYMFDRLKETYPMTNGIVEDEQAVDLCDECAAELLGCFENIVTRNRK